MKNIISNYKDNESKTKTHYDNEVKIIYRDFEDIDLEITCNNTLLSGLCSAENPVPEDIANMIEFHIMQSSPLAKLAAAIIDQEFLTSEAN